ncbi:MAG: endonuclease/exonuclease/phosphatase family protein [Lentisphaeraceae bacterium]|nr:endonuclease/exonuclease/phosphatase family protein [Lentisphaeraceae bacterium]
MKSLIALTGFAAYCGFSYATRGITEIPDIHEFSGTEKSKSSDTLKLMTLNIAHGRGTSINHQLFMKRSKLKRNLDKIAKVIQREKPDFCALQESDARTFYSNELHQSRYLAEKSKMLNCIQGRHVNGMNFIYGTAMLSKKEVSNPLSIAFDFKPPNPTKGVVIASTTLKGTEIDVVSLHLDFMRKKLRHAQLDSLISVLKERNRPSIIMGDFNSEWKQNSSVQALCKKMHLKPWEPENKVSTFPKLKKRLDWILIPEELSFKSFKVLDDRLSDHQAVFAEIS